MEDKKVLVPVKYQQPVRSIAIRALEGNLEKVDYIPESHMRIWYNNQPDSYELHWHEALEVIICTENQYNVKANGKSYILNVGDILFIPPNMPHEIICSSGGIRFVCLFNIELLNNFRDYKALDPVFMDAYLCNANTCPGIYQSVYSDFINAIDIYFSNPIMWETKIFSILLNVFSNIGINYFKNGNNTSVSSNEQKSREHFEKITYLLNYIDTNYSEELTLEQAASYIGFSKYHFTRLFKQYTNSTFYDYLCHKRVQAAQLMLATNMPITNIAFQTGFNNMTTFCRCFKKITNCTPSEYRNSFRTEDVD